MAALSKKFFAAVPKGKPGLLLVIDEAPTGGETKQENVEPQPRVGAAVGPMNDNSETGGGVLAKPVRVRGLFDYSACDEREMSFKKEDVLLVSEQYPNGWWYASLAGHQGFIPCNYVELL
eukprot:TRINITY_DN2179_c0_g1_i1.p2 TRINITY_DN2179_c0_g1~~TRINITY_DN2179_c0_g1_i1.p2  ORF type:complete len:120 (-),score=36.09 TRINITY_DN2179_c0_g1_i1:47-406(-)